MQILLASIILWPHLLMLLILLLLVFPVLFWPHLIYLLICVFHNSHCRISLDCNNSVPSTSHIEQTYKVLLDVHCVQNIFK